MKNPWRCTALIQLIPVLIPALLLLARSPALLACATPVQERPRVGTHLGVLPIANYTTDRGLSLGAVAQRFDYGTDGRFPFLDLWTFRASHSTLGPRYFQLAYERTGVTSLDLRLHAHAVHYDNSYQPYYGIGAGSVFDPALVPSGSYRYREQNTAAQASVRKHHHWAVPVDFEAGATITRNVASSLSADSRYALDRGQEASANAYARLHLRAILERRNSEFVPSQGYYLTGSVFIAPAALSTLPTWSRFELDYRRYDSLIEQRWLWLATQFRYAGSGVAAPLLEKAQLGSLDSIRGLPLNRFLGDRTASLRTELRSLWLRRSCFGLPLKLGNGLFVDTGRISDTTSGLLSARTEAAVGVSFFGSYFTDDFIGTADFGVSRHGTALYLKLGHAF